MNISTDQRPLFCPDATRGVIRSLDSQDILSTKTECMIVNTLHLMERPGIEKLREIGGLKKLMNWPGQLISDSGGFQIFSLFHSDLNRGRITDEGLKIYTGPTHQGVNLFSPEKSIQVQFAIGSDIKVCLDDFTPVDADVAGIEKSVRRTIAWAARSKAEFERLLKLKAVEQTKLTTSPAPPQLFAVIQGHQDKYWRRYCADALLEIGFSGYGLGGWLFHPSGQIDYDIMRYNAALTPPEFPRYAMGFGKPEDIVKLYQMGYTIFDVVLPTRDARHGRLYVFTPEFRILLQDQDKNKTQIQQLLQQNHFYRYLYLDKTSLATHLQPVDLHCDCHTCQSHSTAYLHHLHKISDSSADRLASIHNLFFYQELMQFLPLINNPQLL